MTDMWAYRDATWTESSDVVGYDVEAEDGSIGSVDKATYDASDAYVVVDTGFWIFGKKRLIPAGVIVGVDHSARKVRIAMTKEQVKSAPDYDSDADQDRTGAGRSRHGEYYGRYAS
jgi:hypothetical protein